MIKDMWVTRILVLLALIGMSDEVAWSYKESTHAQIARDAFKYMIQRQAEDMDGHVYDYRNGWTSQKDYEIALQWLGLNSNADPKVIENNMNALFKAVADEAANTDHFRDIGLRPTTLWSKFIGLFSDDCVKEIQDHNFTSLQHFYLTNETDDLWRIPGYTYDLSNRDDIDETAFSFFNRFVGMKVSMDCSKLSKYEDDPDVLKPSLFEKNWDLDLKYVRFPPITSMARWYYMKFLASPSAGPGPRYIQYLGPVLHALGDVTVPYHVVGILGHGHHEYEALIRDSYPELYDSKRIRQYLTHAESDQNLFSEQNLIHASLDHTLDPISIMENLAQYTLRYEGKRRDPINYRFKPGITNDVENKLRGRDLLNLAVSANIVLFRSAFGDWQKAHRLTKGKLTNAPESGVLQERRPSVDPYAVEYPIPVQHGLAVIPHSDASELTVRDFLPLTWLDRLPNAALRSRLETLYADLIRKLEELINANSSAALSGAVKKQMSCELFPVFYEIFGKGAQNSIGGDYPPQTAILRLSSSEQTYMLHGPRFQTPRNDTGSTGRTYQDLHDRRRLYEQVFTAMQLITADVLRESMAMNRLSIEASDRAIEQPPAVCGGLPSYLTVYKDLLEQTSGHHVRLQTNLDEAKRAVETSYETARQIVNSAGGNIPQGVGPAEFYAKLDMYYDLGDEDTKKRIFLAEQNLMEARFRESQVEKHLIQSRLDRDEFAERIGRINDLRRDIESIGLGDKHDGLESGVEK